VIPTEERASFDTDVVPRSTRDSAFAAVDAKRHPSVVPRSEIPLASATGRANLEVRHFVGHDLLGRVLSSSEVALSWIRALPGEETGVRSNRTHALLIVFEGRAELREPRRLVERGDVVTLPMGHEYSLRATDPLGFHALEVAFHEEPCAETAQAHTLEGLLVQNEMRAQLLLNNPFFLLLRGGGPDTEQELARLRECARVFADAFQKFLFTRQSMCRDRDYEEAFLDHLREEQGHNRLLDVALNAGAFNDAVLKAVSNWFSHQMLVLDNVDKAVVNLVLETAGYYFGVLAGAVFHGTSSAPYFDAHAEGDAEHKDVGMRLVAEQTPETYTRLQRVLDASWDMLEAMTRRIAQLVQAERAAQ
jgi:hypothetical protein